ncbi:MAG: CinA family protein [Pseudomonadota bacterium]
MTEHIDISDSPVVDRRSAALPDHEVLVARVRLLADALLERGQRLATAESCTGGLLSACCTELPGSSDWFDRGWVTYTNAAKIELIQVPNNLIEQHGAVSVEVADAMAHGAMMASEGDWGVGITGIAGPSGGSEEKPVGTVCFGVASRSGLRYARRYQFSGERSDVRAQSVRAAVDLLLQHLSGDSV